MPVSLDLPQTLITAGPAYSTMINTALSALASATHVGGSTGDKWTSASINVDADLAFNSFSATGLKATTYAGTSSVSTARSVWFETGAAGDLWVTTGAGTQIQVTAGGSLNTAALIASIWKPLAVATNYTVGASDAYTSFRFDTSAARAFNLPAASGVSPGRFYVVQDVTGGAASNNITVNRAGSDLIDGATSFVIDEAYGWVILVSNGSNAWSTLTERNATTTRKGRLALAGDLGGTAASPTVVGLTGAAGTVPLRSSVSKIEFNAAAPGCTFGIADSAGAVVNTNIRGQNAGGSNNNGGTVLLIGGANTGTGRPGGVTLSTGAGTVGFEVGAFSGSRRFVSLGTNPGSSDIPTGDGVVYIAEATTTPSSNPVGGGVLFVSGGALVWRSPAGTVTTMGLA